MRRSCSINWPHFYGVAEGLRDWFVDADQKIFRKLGRVSGRKTLFLLGHTHEYWVGYWPTSHVEPSSFINQTQKQVLSSTAPAQVWTKTTLATNPVADYVRNLKR